MREHVDGELEGEEQREDDVDALECITCVLLLLFRTIMVMHSVRARACCCQKHCDFARQHASERIERQASESSKSVTVFYRVQLGLKRARDEVAEDQSSDHRLHDR